MKTELVALLTVACTLVHAIPRPGDTSQMKGQTSTTTSPPTPSGSGMSPESTNSMSTPNIADQGKQSNQQMTPPIPSSPQTPQMQQAPMNNMQGSPAMGQGMPTGSMNSQSDQPSGQNMYQMGQKLWSKRKDQIHRLGGPGHDAVRLAVDNGDDSQRQILRGPGGGCKQNFERPSNKRKKSSN